MFYLMSPPSRGSKMMKKSSASWKTKQIFNICYRNSLLLYKNYNIYYYQTGHLYKYEDFALWHCCIKIPYSTKRLSLACFYIKITTYTNIKLDYLYKYEDFALGRYCIKYHIQQKDYHYLICIRNYNIYYYQAGPFL